MAGVVILVVTGYAAAYGVFALLTRGAPPPPSFERSVKPDFAVSLDGRWYIGGCQVVQIVGGWMLPARASLPLGRRRLQLVEPIDLTDLKRPPASKEVALLVSGKSETVDVRWMTQKRLVIGMGPRERAVFARNPGKC